MSGGPLIGFTGSPEDGDVSKHDSERGKLSVDVNYVVQPDGQLTARNKLVLNQLTFGDKVESPAYRRLGPDDLFDIVARTDSSS